MQNDGKAKNPDEFNAKEITVSYSEGDLKNEATIELKVVTHKGHFDNNNMTFKTEPIVGMDSWKMVLRWDAVFPLNNGFFNGPHAIYADGYNMEEKVYTCINSWGENNLPTPRINISKIYAIDYISI